MVSLPVGQLSIGLIASLVIGLPAYRLRWLTAGGVAAAALVGTLTFGLGGFAWAAVVVAFFVSSSLLSHYRADLKRSAAMEIAKGWPRDAYQVLANGGMAALLAVLGAVFSNIDSGLVFAGFVGAMSAVAADTWATELGLLSKERPRLITTWQPSRAGASGAVTTLGLVAAATGALLIGSAATAGSFVQGLFGDVFVRSLLWLPSTALVAGWLGSVGDSLLGATMQAMYYCPPDDKHTERAVHACGRAAIHTRGFIWMTNDVVNFLASAIGAVLGASVYLVLGG